MLRWQIDEAKKRIKDTHDALSECGEVYSLPKPTDGLPDNWAFGKLTSHEVSLNHALQGLIFAGQQLELADADLSNADLPSAIFRIIKVNNTINSTTALWASASSVRAYRYIGKYRQSKSVIARHNRKVKPSKRELLGDREAYFAEKATYQGWLKHAQNKYFLSAKSINSILK